MRNASLATSTACTFSFDSLRTKCTTSYAQMTVSTNTRAMTTVYIWHTTVEQIFHHHLLPHLDATCYIDMLLSAKLSCSALPVSLSPCSPDGSVLRTTCCSTSVIVVPTPRTDPLPVKHFVVSSPSLFFFLLRRDTPPSLHPSTLHNNQRNTLTLPLPASLVHLPGMCQTSPPLFAQNLPAAMVASSARRMIAASVSSPRKPSLS